jgi:hypothetical protein
MALSLQELGSNVVFYFNIVKTPANAEVLFLKNYIINHGGHDQRQHDQLTHLLLQPFQHNG